MCVVVVLVVAGISRFPLSPCRTLLFPVAAPEGCLPLRVSSVAVFVVVVGVCALPCGVPVILASSLLACALVVSTVIGSWVQGMN